MSERYSRMCRYSIWTVIHYTNTQHDTKQPTCIQNKPHNTKHTHNIHKIHNVIQNTQHDTNTHHDTKHTTWYNEHNLIQKHNWQHDTTSQHDTTHTTLYETHNTIQQSCMFVLATRYHPVVPVLSGLSYQTLYHRLIEWMFVRSNYWANWLMHLTCLIYLINFNSSNRLSTYRLDMI